MRYLFIGLAILLLAGSACASAGATLDSTLDEIASLLEASEESFLSDDMASALDLAERANALWLDHKLLIDASTIRSMNSSASAALALLRDTLSDDPDRAHPLYAEALEAVEHLQESEKLSLANLL